MGIANLSDEFELGLQPICVTFLAFKNVFEDVAAAMIGVLDTHSNPSIEPIDGFAFELQGEV